MRCVCEDVDDGVLRGERGDGLRGLLREGAGRGDDRNQPDTRDTRAGGWRRGGLAGSVLYYAILAMSGYEFGLIAIVVGMAVGKAVNWGAYGRGGWRYQTMAIALTYLAIVSSYVPLIISEIGRQPVAAEASARPGETATPAAQNQAATSPAHGGGCDRGDPILSGWYSRFRSLRASRTSSASSSSASACTRRGS